MSDVRRTPVLVGACALALAVCGCGPSETPLREDTPLPSPDLSVLDPLVAQAISENLAELTERPDDAAAWRTLALTADANAEYATAVAAYEGWLERDPDSAKGWALLARVRRELTDGDEAYAALERSVELAPDHGPSWALLGRWRLADGDLDAAAEAFERATRAAPDLAAGWVGVARTAMQQDDLAAADAALATWLARAPDDLHAVWLLGTLRRRQGRVDEAAALIAQGAGAEPRWRDPWEDDLVAHLAGYHAVMDRAVALGQAGRGAEAAPALARLASARPDDLAVLEKLIAAELDAGRHERALRRLDDAAPIFGDHPRTAYLRGLCHEQAGDFEAARDAAAASVDALPWPPALALLARLHWRLGDVAGAGRHLEQLVALDPDDLPSRQKLARALSLTERPADAAAVLDAALARFPASADLHAQRAELALAAGDLDLAWSLVERATTLGATSYVERTRATLAALDPAGAAQRGGDS